MLPKLKEVEYRGDYRVWFRFDDGVEGEVDLRNELWGDVFEPLLDKERFSELALDPELDTLVWQTGADLAPEFLYQLLRPNYVLKPTPAAGAA